MIKRCFVIALIAVSAALTASAQAQNTLQAAAPEPKTAAAATQEPTLGIPVRCTAHGYFSGNSVTLILKQLDATRGIADVEAINTFGIALKKDTFDRNGAKWTFANGVLKYDRPNAIRWKLTVKDRQLEGSYWNAGGERYSIPKIIFDCLDSTKRIIVP